VNLTSRSNRGRDPVGCCSEIDPFQIGRNRDHPLLVVAVILPDHRALTDGGDVPDERIQALAF
jgi:hypothetical protein